MQFFIMYSQCLSLSFCCNHWVLQVVKYSHDIRLLHVRKPITSRFLRPPSSSTNNVLHQFQCVLYEATDGHTKIIWILQVSHYLIKNLQNHHLQIPSLSTFNVLYQFQSRMYIYDTCCITLAKTSTI